DFAGIETGVVRDANLIADVKGAFEQDIEASDQVFQNILNGDGGGDGQHADGGHGDGQLDLPDGKNPECRNDEDNKIESTGNQRADVDVDAFLAQSPDGELPDCACNAYAEYYQKGRFSEVNAKASNIFDIKLIECAEEQIEIPDADNSYCRQHERGKDNEHAQRLDKPVVEHCALETTDEP